MTKPVELHTSLKDFEFMHRLAEGRGKVMILRSTLTALLMDNSAMVGRLKSMGEEPTKPQWDPPPPRVRTRP